MSYELRLTLLGLDFNELRFMKGSCSKGMEIVLDFPMLHLIGCVGLSQNDPSEIPSTLLKRLVNWPGTWNDNV